MKQILNQIVLFIVLGLVLSNFITYKSCTNYKNKYNVENERVFELYRKCDSILDLPPDTVKLPPEIIKGKDSIVHITKWKERPNKPELEPQLYNDSIINDSIDVRLEIAALELYDVKYDYRPIYKYQEKIVYIYVPKPVEVINEVEIYHRGLFGNVGLGYSDVFCGKVGVMYITKNQSTYSYDFVRYGDKNIHIVSYGIKF